MLDHAWAYESVDSRRCVSCPAADGNGRLSVAPEAVDE